MKLLVSFRKGMAVSFMVIGITVFGITLADAQESEDKLLADSIFNSNEFRNVLYKSIGVDSLHGNIQIAPAAPCIGNLNTLVSEIINMYYISGSQTQNKGKEVSLWFSHVYDSLSNEQRRLNYEYPCSPATSFYLDGDTFGVAFFVKIDSLRLYCEVYNCSNYSLGIPTNYKLLRQSSACFTAVITLGNQNKVKNMVYNSLIP